jgi:hypothetical protein
VRSGKRRSSKSEVELAVAGTFWCRVSCLAARPDCGEGGGRGVGGGRESGFGAESLGSVSGERGLRGTRGWGQVSLFKVTNDSVSWIAHSAKRDVWVHTACEYSVGEY